MPQHSTLSRLDAFDFAVVGKGLIGSAALRYLSTTGGSGVIIGPDEPKVPAEHQGVFASHYDEGRITRLIGRDRIYSKLAERAIEQYATIESVSGIRFHYPVGMLIVQAPHIADGHMKDPLGTARALGRKFTLYEVGDRSWKERFPDLEFPETYSVIHEPAPAGYINPRALIRAQLAIASKEGVHVVRETATAIRRNGAGFVIETDAGDGYLAGNVVVAAGAFTNFNSLLPRPLDFRPKTESVILAEVSEADFERLGKTPTVIYLVDDIDIWDIYMTPPIRYPNGRFYIKLGANSVLDRELTTLGEVQAWFRTGTNHASRVAMEAALHSLWPDVEILACEAKPCILCHTPNGYPIIDEIDKGLVVAAGGNGGSAKCSDTLGKLAASLLTGAAWPEAIPRDLFSVG